MPAGEDVSVSGIVQTGDGAPIHMIKVTIYREDREVAHAFTGENGKYVMSVAKGKPITIRFDTHYSLNNAGMASVGGGQRISYGRRSGGSRPAARRSRRWFHAFHGCAERI